MTTEHITRLKALGIDLGVAQQITPCCGGDIEISLLILSGEWFVFCECGMTGPTTHRQLSAVNGWNDFISTFKNRQWRQG